jgi:glucose-1-phosphate adenylyltransferase
LLANGCEIYGTVENSVLFRGVKVAPGAVVRNSVIMQKSVIEEGAEIDCVIADKNVVITKGKHLRGADSFPVMIGKYITI